MTRRKTRPEWKERNGSEKRANMMTFAYRRKTVITPPCDRFKQQVTTTAKRRVTFLLLYIATIKQSFKRQEENNMDIIPLCGWFWGFKR